eukprot:TCONS_00061541-protein
MMNKNNHHQAGVATYLDNLEDEDIEMYGVDLMASSLEYMDDELVEIEDVEMPDSVKDAITEINLEWDDGNFGIDIYLPLLENQSFESYSEQMSSKVFFQ